MRTSNICYRVEPATAEGLTALTRKYNYERELNLTKTDIVELLIKAACVDSDMIDLARCIIKSEGSYRAYEIYLES